ncbi:hypothetical protein ACWEOE_39315 [Amycolatopsis sp. NPDC004368]
MHPTLVVEVRAETSVLAFTNRQRPHVHRLRLDLSPGDVAPEPDPRGGAGVSAERVTEDT